MNEPRYHEWKIERKREADSSKCLSRGAVKNSKNQKHSHPQVDMHEILFNEAAIEENGTWCIVDIDF